ncbi:MAG: hypothetical protein JOZ24_02725 [Candidatus Eremiobacteraeota bacterium]|nr:hypothetical protein [Candidatus Eremiobacteraeota bacterium]
MPSMSAREIAQQFISNAMKDEHSREEVTHFAWSLGATVDADSRAKFQALVEKYAPGQQIDVATIAQAICVELAPRIAALKSLQTVCNKPGILTGAYQPPTATVPIPA